MDIKEITNQIQDWCLEDKEKRCALVVISEKEGDDLKNIFGIIGKNINLHKAVYESMKNSKEFINIVLKAMMFVCLGKVTDGTEEEKR